MDVKETAAILGLDEDEYMDMLDLFFESGGSDLKKIEAAVAAGDAGRGHEASHSLKGSAGSLGLNAIYALTSIIDDRLRRGELDGVKEMVRRLRKEYDGFAAETGRKPA